MKNKGSSNNSFLRRYTALISSIVIFLLLIAAILSLNYYASLQINKDTTAINTSSKMRDSLQTITKDLFDMKLSYGEDVNSPHIKTALKNLTENSAFLSQSLNAFENGGSVDDVGGKSVFIDAVKDPLPVESIQKAQSAWKLFKPTVTHYLETATDFDSTSTPLDLSVLQAQSSSLVMYAAVDKLASHIEKTAAERADLLKIIQLVGLSLILLYFLIFIFFFIRRLRNADRQAEAAKKETDSIMATVNEGLFLVDDNFTISDQYSAQLESIIGKKDLAGKQLSDLIESMVSEKDLQAARGFVNQLFNPKVKQKLIQDLNPLDRVETMILNDYDEPEERFLTFNFSRVRDGKRISRVLASVSDITKAVQLERQLDQEREQNDNQLAMLSDILNADEQILSSFIRHSKEATTTVNEILKRPDKTKADLQQKAQDIFREIHGLKGEASALKLENFVNMTNTFEDKITEIQNRPRLTGNDFLPLTVELEQLIEDTNKAERLLGRLGGDGISSADIMGSGASDLPSSQPSRTSTSTYSLEDHFEQYVQDVAARNNKQVHFRSIGMENLSANDTTMDKVKDTITQLIRNSIVHGIETPTERSAKGKQPTGIIQIKVSEEPSNMLQLTVDDDGQGLNCQTILNKAIEKGIISEQQAQSLSKPQIHQLIFHSGLSTADSVGEDAGRGVGMDVIKERVKQLNGKMGLLSEQDKYTRFVIQLPK